MSKQQLISTPLFQRLGRGFPWEVAWAVPASFWLALCHETVPATGSMLVVYCLGIAAVIVALGRRRLLARALLVLSVAGAATAAHLYFKSNPGAHIPGADTVAEMALFVALLVLLGRLAVGVRRFDADNDEPRAKFSGDNKTMLGETAALTQTSLEIRKTLSPVLAITEALLDAREDEESRLSAESVSTIDGCAKHLLGLVGNTLDYARTQSGAIRLAPEPVALPDLIEQCMAIVEPAAADVQVTISAQIDSDVKEITADPLRLKQILLNLLANGVKFNEPGGSVKIQARTDQKDVLISVRDAGRGLSREQMEHLFDPYRHVADGDCGLDVRLGLAVVKQLVERHGGSFSAESVREAGSIFVARLPNEVLLDDDVDASLAADPIQEDLSERIRHVAASRRATPRWEEQEEPEVDPDATSTSTGETGDGMRVLVADDSPTVRRILRQLLTSLGWETIEAEDGRQALELARRRPVPDAIVLDPRLSEIDGYEVCRTLKNDSQYHLIPIVVATSSDSPAEQTHALEAGADDLLAKPISRAELTIRLRALLRMHKFGRELIGVESVAAALAKAVAAKDGYAQSHQGRMANYAESLGRARGLDVGELKTLKQGALLHNVGKIAVPDAVLEKTGPLTPREMALLHQHPRVGCDICAPLTPLKPVLATIRHHKERWDGSGYPDGLRGDEIPLGAQIVSIVDAYTAMTSDRPYRRRLSHAEAVTNLREQVCQGHHNPELAEQFIALLEAEQAPAVNAGKTAKREDGNATSERPDHTSEVDEQPVGS